MEIQKNEFVNNQENSVILGLGSFLFLLFFLFCVLSLSLAVSQVVNSDWAASKYFSDSFLDFLLVIFPFWLLLIYFISLVLIIPLSAYTFVLNKIQWPKRIIILFFSPMIVSLLFFYGEVSTKIDSYLQQFSQYQMISSDTDLIWTYPEFGLLAGNIGRIKDLSDFLLVDLEGRTWKIDSSDAYIENISIIESGNKIKIIGQIKDDQFFKADKIFIYQNESY